MSQKTILFVSVNDRCYASYRFFAKRLAEAAERQGISAAWCYLPEGGGKDEASWDRVLQEVLGKPYLAVVDFNSFLPKLAADEKNLIDLFEAPFYHVVLDHPLYHHAALSARTDLQRVICVDERHADYVRANYPQISQVWTQTIPGTAGALADKPYQERKNEILFCGTYEEPQRYWELMNELPAELKKECRLLAERMLDRPDQTMEELLAAMWEDKRHASGTAEEMYPLCGTKKRQTDGVHDPRFAARMQADFLADAYVRNLRRKQTVEALVRARQPLALYGQGWEQIGAQSGGMLSYENYVNHIGNYRFALHCMPGFVCGGHDRIGNAMRNGAVCISDRTQYTRSRYEQGAPVYIGYETGQTDGLISQCEYYLSHTQEAEEIAAAGRHYAETNDTWEHFAARLIAHAGG